MSAAWRTAWQVLTAPLRLVWTMLGALAVIAVLLALLAIGLAWRLAQGPLDVTPLVRAAEALRPESFATIRVGRASVAWNGFNGGAHSGLELQVENLRTVDKGGKPAASVSRADVTLAALPLLSAKVEPRRIVLDGVDIRAVRRVDGRVRLDLDGGASGGSGESTGDGGTGGLLSELRRPVGSAESDPALAALQQVVIEHAHLAMIDEASGKMLDGTVADLELHRRDGGGITGSARGRLTVGGASVSVQLDADLMPDGGTKATVSLMPLETESIDVDVLTRFDPALGRLGRLNGVVEARTTLDLSPALHPERATMHVSIGPGRLAVPNSAPVVFERASVDASATWKGDDWRPDTVRIEPAEAVLISATSRPTALRFTANGKRDEAHWIVQATAGFDHAAFGDLPSLWPVAWGGHLRPWLTENVTAGLAHDAAFTATLNVPTAAPDQTKVIAAAGSMEAEGVRINWLRPVPPITQAHAVLRLTGPDTLSIDISHARQGPIELSDGKLRFSGLSKKDQFLAISAAVHGKVSDLLTLLREPRLELLAAHPLPITGSAGLISAELKVGVPLLEDVKFEQVSIGATGRLTGLRLDGIVAGHDLSHGNVTFDASQDRLKASGDVTLAGVPGRAEVGMVFTPGKPTDVTQRATFSGSVGAAALAANGIDAEGMLTGGAARATVEYTEQRDGSARVAAKADLTPAGLSIAGWRKAPGAAARAAATVLIRHGALTGVPMLTASGPGLDIDAQAETVGGSPRILRVRRVVLGPTRLSGEVIFPPEPSGPVLIRATGPILDLSGVVKNFSGGGSGGGRSGIVDVRLGRVLLGDGRVLTNVALHAERSGGQLRALQVATGGDEQLHASIAPVPGGRRLLVQAADTGALLRGLALTSSIGGGTLSVDATFDDRYADPPLAGRLWLSKFGVRDAVTLGKLLQAATLYGIVDALRREGVYFADAQVPFSLHRNVLQLGPSRASSSSLGLTANGWVDFDRNVMDLTGTVVPAYVVNAALGRLPMVGRLFSAEQGGGLIAMNYGLTGKPSDPAVSVNPLSLLTPGILRRLFE